MGHLGPKMAPRWPQDGPKSSKNLENQFLGPPLGGHFGAQNRFNVNVDFNIDVDVYADLQVDLDVVDENIGCAAS